MKNLNFESSEILGRDQLKVVYGGGNPGLGCFDDCKSNSDCGGDCPTCYFTQGQETGGCGS